MLPEIQTNKKMRYVSHPIADIMYRITTPTDIGVIIRANDKVFWARNSSNPTMEASLFLKIVSMRMYGCINTKFKILLRYIFKINCMSTVTENKPT